MRMYAFSLRRSRPTRLVRLLAAGCLLGILTMPLPVDAIMITWTDKASSGFDTAEKAVVDAAIARWEALITDFGPLTAGRLTFSVSITEAPTAGIGVAFGFMADPAGIPLSGSITIDDGTFAAAFGGFFVDPSPGANSEYVSGTYIHYGTAASGGSADGKKDLLTVVLHELGHTLGFEDSFTPWSLRISPPTTLLYDIIPPSMSATLSDVDHLAHVLPDQPFDLMASAGDLPTSGIGDRRLPSALDLDILEGIYLYTVDRGSLEAISGPGVMIPEPSMWIAFAPSLLMLLRLRAVGTRRSSAGSWSLSFH